MNLAWSIALAAVGILGIYLAGNKSRLGWAVSFGAQVLWITFAIVTAQYGFILSALAYGAVYGRNYLRWRKEQTAPPFIQGRTLYTGSLVDGDWHQGPPFIELSDGRLYDGKADEY